MSQLRKAAALALTAAAIGLAVPAVTPGATADTPAQHAIFLVKDLGGGAYWNVTTSSLYVLAAGSDAVVGVAASTADLLATLASDGRSLLLLINGAVLVPVQDAL
jgi:hypothetical protein